MHPLPSAPAFSPALAARLAAARSAVAPETIHARHRDDSGGPRYTNRLALESSPYLLGHAHNPVNWYPWGDEAFAEALRLGRPVFLSIGYSTCHWCHVMEEESFEDEAIADFLNANYLAIKVDREERPDVDAIYMRAAEQLTGSGGWPLSVWLTPEREPFFAGTYFPPRAGARGAEIGLLEILHELVRLYHEQPARVSQASHALADAVRADVRSPTWMRQSGSRPGADRADLALVSAAVEQCACAYDDQHGGLRVMHKFPSQVPIRLLLRHAQRSGDRRALHMALHTLEAMARGGIYDHLVGGFHRYATDPTWLVPHFEKMLYDSALLVPAYAEAWQVTKRDLFLRVVRQTCDELLATFAAPGGGFYSATDADSEGEEGRFFLWSEDEIRAVLGPGEEAESFVRYYGVTGAGNFEGRNILYERDADEATVRRLAGARARLAEARRRRIPPLRDDKILAAWNGLAVSAFAVAGWIADEPRYLDAARRAAAFVLEHMRDPQTGRLARGVRDDRLGVLGFLSDHACVAAGLLDLFEYTGEARWFEQALDLCEQTDLLFADSAEGGWFATSADHEHLLAREKPTLDGAELSGGSVALLNAARLAALTDDQRWHDLARRGLRFYLPFMRRHPLAAAESLRALDFLAGPVHQIVIALPTRASGYSLDQALREAFCPRKVLLRGVPGQEPWQRLEDLIPILRGRGAQGGQATAYVCSSGRCEVPTTEADQLRRQLDHAGSTAAI
jgi:uncharacterized protein YyaL (SSP411 family)